MNVFVQKKMCFEIKKTRLTRVGYPFEKKILLSHDVKGVFFAKKSLVQDARHIFGIFFCLHTM
jgi:hypothetical protein